ncbi:hypothetical protein [Actinoplanes rectilineatus]|uniref:hypothetical protein n=1 Tax=Actinoplanes rectilineatus TaxID=113571 RepID=UPI0005F28237|nr:hypothetical protein [Actinoplanes rectilineatus]
MVVASAVLTGAGVSRGHPAGLPLGDEFHAAMLTGCAEAAAALTGEPMADEPDIDGRRNVLGCIEDCVEHGTVAGVLDLMRVRLPSEEHLLCALLAARGVLQITLNFDNGIELGYALLTGQTPLPPDAPEPYHRALAAWRAEMPPSPPLRVVSAPGRLDLDHRPLLVKLRGSVDADADAMVVPLRPTMEDLEGVLLDTDRRRALCAAVDSGHLLVVGHSGRDLDVFETLVPLLRPGRFDWVAAALTDRVAARLAAVDPSQPRPGRAVDVLRAQLGALPAWPARPLGDPDFGTRFAAWWRQVPPVAAAEAYGWLLSDAGRHTEAATVLRAVSRQPGLSPSATARIRVRLADALARSGAPADTAEALRLWSGAATGRGARTALRAYAMIRRTEARTATGHPPLLALPAAAAALLLAQPTRARRRATVRVLIGIGRIALTHAETRRSLTAAAVARAALASAVRGARRAGTAHRQSDLELLRLRTRIVRALLRGTAPPPVTASLDAVDRAYRHRGDHDGRREVDVVRALLAAASSR